jgi:hypothetical protein
MFLFTDPTLTEFEQQGENLANMIDRLKQAYSSAVLPETTVTTLTAINDEAKKVARTIGSGVVLNAEGFREKLFEIQQSTVDIGGKFADVTEVVESLADQTGKLTLPSSQAAKQMIELSKATGLGNKEVGQMTGQFMELTMSQKGSTQEMARISELARKTGVNAQKLLSDVVKDLKKIDAFNFKSGEKGLANMVAQAQRLGTSIDNIKAFSFAEELLDPEKAIQAAADFSMLGGSVGDMMNPFALMNDAANNVDNLQTKMIDLAKSAFKIDESTGKIETNFLAQQRLREQVKVFGGDYEEYLKLGRAASKEQLVANKLLSQGIDITKFSEEQQNLVKSLAEIGDGGKIELRLPNFDTDDLASTLSTNKTAFTDALTEYQTTAAMSDRALAEKSLTLEETQQVDTRIIRDTLLKQLTVAEKNSVIDAFKSGQDELAEEIKTLTKASTGPAKGVITTIPGLITESKTEMQRTKKSATELTQDAIDARAEAKNKANLGGITMDGLFGEGEKVLSLGKGQLFNFIKEDEAAFAPDMAKNLGILKETYLNFMGVSKMIPSDISLIEPKSSKTAEIPSKEINTTTNINNTNKDTIDVNINVTVETKGTATDSLFKNQSSLKELEQKVMDVLDKQNFLKAGKGRFNR